MYRSSSNQARMSYQVGAGGGWITGLHFFFSKVAFYVRTAFFILCSFFSILLHKLQTWQNQTEAALKDTTKSLPGPTKRWKRLSPESARTKRTRKVSRRSVDHWRPCIGHDMILTNIPFLESSPLWQQSTPNPSKSKYFLNAPQCRSSYITIVGLAKCQWRTSSVEDLLWIPKTML